MSSTPSIPEHLEQFVVEQEYEQYTAVDQAVWRFVLLQTYARLQQVAHGAYRTGLEATGISVEHIPRIAEMNEKLSRFGWGAVCVDGFIPPRAFQGFQANGILPIAADIRTVAHLAYTPAPDIIHEAAGHAPILSEPAYARYIKNIGQVGGNAFSMPADREVYRAIYTLSEVKENPASTPEQVARAERALERALAAVGEPSEANRLARLYWWTAEYGLVGTTNDYRLYGAGLLSSLGESQSCHDPSVKKVALSPECIDVDYDITRAQPQLFVARDFDHLEEVLSDVGAKLAYRVGGEHALETAVRSEEVATVTLDSGVELVGVVARIGRSERGVRTVEFSGTTAIGRDGALLPGLPRQQDYLVQLGMMADGTPLSSLSLDALARHGDSRGRLELRLDGGERIRGTLRSAEQHDGRLLVVVLESFELQAADGRVFRSQAPYPLALGAEARTARAGALPGFFPPTPRSALRIPKPRWFAPAERDLLSLYERAVESWRGAGGTELVSTFERISDELDERFGNDWLLRWNLLESLVKVGEGAELARRLERDLEDLEVRYAHLEPIATGLEYIRSIGGGDEARDPA